ncbi:MAG: response regulator [Verrucomicrobia bacterium]|jgi:CheY-like chemotaxis protein|nr:MAG: response regulator [Verrucomicrobiota bacterium]
MRVLVADDDRDMAAALADCVQACGHEVVDTVTSGGLAVIQSFARHAPDAVLLDILMPRCNGLTVCHALLSRAPKTRVIFISGSVDRVHPFVESCGSVACLSKPVSLIELRAALDAPAE